MGSRSTKKVTRPVSSDPSRLGLVWLRLHRAFRSLPLGHRKKRIHKHQQKDQEQQNDSKVIANEELLQGVFTTSTEEDYDYSFKQEPDVATLPVRDIRVVVAASKKERHYSATTGHSHLDKSSTCADGGENVETVETKWVSDDRSLSSISTITMDPAFRIRIRHTTYTMDNFDDVNNNNNNATSCSIIAEEEESMPNVARLALVEI